MFYLIYMKYFLAFFILIVFFMLLNYPEYFTTTPVLSNIDNKQYRVITTFGDYKEATDKLANINDFIINFLRYLKNKFIINRNGNKDEIKFVQRILNNYNPDNIFENFPILGENTSFVINKGESFGICLREKENHNFHTFSLLKFVILHEMTHMGTIQYGHDYEFWSWFKFITIEATKSGLYDPINYSNNNVNYCGLNITFNPYYDNNKYDWNTPKANP